MIETQTFSTVLLNSAVHVVTCIIDKSQAYSSNSALFKISKILYYLPTYRVKPKDNLET